MAVNYGPTKPVAGASRATAPTEVDRWSDYADTIADVNTRLTNATSAVGGIVTRTSLQSIPNATATAIAFTSELHDSSTFADLATFPTRLTVPAGEAGIYACLATCEFNSSTGGTERVWHLKVNGTEFVALDARPPFGKRMRASPSAGLNLVAGDYVELIVYQDTGAALDVTFSIVAPA